MSGEGRHGGLPSAARPADGLRRHGRCVFVTGSSRSGTELLRGILNGHPDVHVAAETHYFADFRPRVPVARVHRPTPQDWSRATRFFEGLRGSAYGLNGAERDALAGTPAPGPASVAPSPGAGLDDLFRDHCRSEALRVGTDPAVWGEKTPRHVFHVDEILSAFPDARLVFMLRDPRAVAASYRDWTNHWLDPSAAPDRLRRALAAEERRVRLSYSLSAATLLWRSALASAEAARRRHGPGRVRIQRFETLLADPEVEVAALSAFIGVEPHEAMLQVPRRNSSYGAAGAAAGFDGAAADAWRQRLSAAEAWWVERLAGPLLDAHGYARASTGPHLGFALREVGRFASRLPGMVAANWRRQGDPVGALTRRVAGLLGARARPGA